MFSDSVSQSIAANVFSTNLLQNRPSQFVGLRSAAVKIYASGSAAGLQTFVTIGGQAITQGFIIPATNRFPLVLEDRIIAVGGLPGEEIVIQMFNTTGGALVAQLYITIG